MKLVIPLIVLLVTIPIEAMERALSEMKFEETVGSGPFGEARCYLINEDRKAYRAKTDPRLVQEEQLSLRGLPCDLGVAQR